MSGVENGGEAPRPTADQLKAAKDILVNPDLKTKLQELEQQYREEKMGGYQLVSGGKEGDQNTRYVDFGSKENLENAMDTKGKFNRLDDNGGKTNIVDAGARNEAWTTFENSVKAGSVGDNIQLNGVNGTVKDAPPTLEDQDLLAQLVASEGKMTLDEARAALAQVRADMEAGVRREVREMRKEIDLVDVDKSKELKDKYVGLTAVVTLPNGLAVRRKVDNKMEKTGAALKTGDSFVVKDIMVLKRETNDDHIYAQTETGQWVALGRLDKGFNVDLRDDNPAGAPIYKGVESKATSSNADVTLKKIETEIKTVIVDDAGVRHFTPEIIQFAMNKPAEGALSWGRKLTNWLSGGALKTEANYSPDADYRTGEWGRETVSEQVSEKDFFNKEYKSTENEIARVLGRDRSGYEKGAVEKHAVEKYVDGLSTADLAEITQSLREINEAQDKVLTADVLREVAVQIARNSIQESVTKIGKKENVTDGEKLERQTLENWLVANKNGGKHLSELIQREISWRGTQAAQAGIDDGRKNELESEITTLEGMKEKDYAKDLLSAEVALAAAQTELKTVTKAQNLDTKDQDKVHLASELIERGITVEQLASTMKRERLGRALLSLENSVKDKTLGSLEDRDAGYTEKELKKQGLDADVIDALVVAGILKKKSDSAYELQSAFAAKNIKELLKTARAHKEINVGTIELTDNGAILNGVDQNTIFTQKLDVGSIKSILNGNTPFENAIRFALAVSGYFYDVNSGEMPDPAKVAEAAKQYGVNEEGLKYIEQLAKGEPIFQPGHAQYSVFNMIRSSLPGPRLFQQLMSARPGQVAGGDVTPDGPPIEIPSEA
jgi:hypothetical protein